MNRRRWAAAVALAGAGAALPAAAQELPYRFVGAWTQGGRAVAVLAYGRLYVTVRQTGPLDANYSVESIDDRHVTLVDTRGVRHRLGEPLPGTRAVPKQPGSAPFMPAPPPVPPDPSEDEPSG